MENVNAIEEKKEEVSTTVQYIVVKIGNEQYGINIKYIDNIVRKQDITRVPKTQHYYKGVINLRGVVVPIIDLKNRFAMHFEKYDDNQRIIILKVNGISAGIMVDSVSEVIEVDETLILPNPKQVNNDINSDYLKGVCKVDGERLMTLLNIEKVLEIKKHDN